MDEILNLIESVSEGFPSYFFKVIKNVPYLEAKKIFENQTPELDFTKIVTSLSAKPESKTIGTQFFESDFTINLSSKVISPSVKPKSQPKPTSVSQSHAITQSQTQGLDPVHHVLILSLVRSLVPSLNLVLNQVLRLVRKRKKKINLRPAKVLVGDHILAKLHPLKNTEKDLMIRLKWPIYSMVY